ncbi:MAG: YabP/YqfC family sporulation protein [Firmicutes bacterium]|nr:YabP/YqfC family sporulation protein [Bacillota bacterium]
MKRRWREKSERLAAQWLEMPADTLERVPRITIIGRTQVIVENYLSLLEFTDTRIRVATGIGETVISGEGLELRTIVPEELLIEGAIHGVDCR